MSLSLSLSLILQFQFGARNFRRIHPRVCTRAPRCLSPIMLYLYHSQRSRLSWPAVSSIRMCCNNIYCMFLTDFMNLQPPPGQQVQQWHRLCVSLGCPLVQLCSGRATVHSVSTGGQGALQCSYSRDLCSGH